MLQKQSRFSRFVSTDGSANFPAWALTALVLLTIGAALFTMNTNYGQKALREDMKDVATELSVRIGEKLDAQLFITRALVSHVEFSPQFVTWNYDTIVSRLVGDDQSILNVALAPGLVIEHVYPRGRNDAVLGIDFGNYEMGNDAIESAVANRKVVLAGPMDIPQGGTAFITRAPIYENSETAGTTGEPWGLASVVLDANSIFDIVRELEEEFGVRIALRGDYSSASETDIFYGVPETFDVAGATNVLPVSGGYWDVAVKPARIAYFQYSEWTLTLLFLYLFTCAAAIATVMTILRHARLRHSMDQQLVDAVNAIDDGFVIYDEHGCFVACNDAYRKFYHTSADLMVPGKPFREIIAQGVARGQYPEADDDPRAFIENRMRLFAQADHESTQQLDNGRWLRIKDRKTMTGATVGVRVDITELREARESAEKAYKVKSEFISVLSHELRTPLTIILGYAKVLANLKMFKSVQTINAELNRDEPDPELVREMVEELVSKTSDQARKIEKSGSHLLVLINDLLDYSKIEAGRLDLTFDKISTKTLIGGVVEDMSDAAFDKGLTLIDDTRDILVDADEIRLKQVLINLIGNAIKFTEEGTITVSSECDGRHLHIMVTDTGCGIEASAHPSVFDAFQQADLSDKRRAGGTGLGLAISRRIVEMHKGRLELESELGKGSTFRMIIPVKQRRRTVSVQLSAA